LVLLIFHARQTPPCKVPPFSHSRFLLLLFIYYFLRVIVISFPSIYVYRLLDEQNRDVGRKLGIATALMFTLPFITYFGCFHYLFAHKQEPANWAGAAAVFVTNCVIAGYVVVAFSEPDEDEEELKKRGLSGKAHSQPQQGGDNDSKHPRTGIFKQRVD